MQAPRSIPADPPRSIPRGGEPELADGINAPGSRSKASRRAGREFETLNPHSPTDPAPASLVRLSYLALDITQAILDGRQPADLTADKQLAHSRLPLAWHDQRNVLGFA